MKRVKGFSRRSSRALTEVLEKRSLLSASTLLAAAAPGNDNFDNAFPLIGVMASATGNNNDATKVTFEPDPAGNKGGASVWWKWIAPKHAGKTSVNTFGSTFDTILGAYSGETFNTIFYVAANDDTGGSQSKIDFQATAGTQYNIVVDGFNNFGIVAKGDISLELLCLPDNDDFANATPLVGNAVADFDGFNTTATKETGEPNPGGISANQSVWWKWTSPASPVSVSVNNGGSNFDTTLGVYTGASVDALTKIADAVTTIDQNSAVDFVSTPNTTYYFLVNGSTQAISSGKVNISLVTGAGPAGAISGNVWNDPNSNGIKDAGETNLAGWTLYLDTNNNNTKDAGETSTTTDAAGNYTFSGLANGTYHVKQQLTSGYRKTKPGTGVPGYDVQVNGAPVTGRDFSNTTNILLAGTCFNDLDGDGIQDVGENGFSGITVNIWSNNTIVATRVTDAAGKWQVKGLAAGTGYAEHTNPTGYFSTIPVNGRYEGSMSSGQQNANLNFGMKFAGAAPASTLARSAILISEFEAIELFD